MINVPVVSVTVVTYNHIRFIEDCLNSIINQKTNFQFELIIGEDESNDGTREICINYANKYPELIRLNLRSRSDVIHINGRPTGRYNFIKNLQACKGKYIALCEGDDYWTDENKLQKQVDFFEMNPGFNIIFTNTKQQTGDQIKPEPYQFSGEFDFADFMQKNSKTLPVRTVSSIFRRNAEGIVFFNDHFCQIVMGDYPMFLLMLVGGKGYFLNDITSVYRKHPGGVSNNFKVESWIESRISVVETLLKYNKVPDQHLVSTQIFLKNLYMKYAKFYVKRGHMRKGIKQLLNWFSAK